MQRLGIAKTTSTVRMVIKVSDRDSLEAKLIKVSDELTMELPEAKPFIGGEVKLYTVTTRVDAGSDAIRNVKLLIESDLEEVSTLASKSGKTHSDTGRISAHSYGMATISIHAMSFESVSAKMTSFDLA